MADTRQRNVNWSINAGASGMFSVAQARLAVLMDIRDELQAINRILGCPNFRAIPQRLSRISAKHGEAATKEKRGKVMVELTQAMLVSPPATAPLVPFVVLSDCCGAPVKELKRYRDIGFGDRAELIEITAACRKCGKRDCGAVRIDAE